MSFEKDKIGILESLKAASKIITDASRRGRSVNGIIMHVSSPERRQFLEALGYHKVGKDIWKRK